MPMYEKGSVRAEPRSKQQERMKKTMKKFLSSLLALTMILSLVIVPANAAADITDTATVKRGETTTLTAFDKPAKVEVSGTEYTVTDAAPTYRWTSGTPANATVPSSSRDSTVVVTGVKAGTSEITCEMGVTYAIPADTSAGTEASTKTTTVSKSYTVTVTDAFLASDVTKVHVNGRDYNVTKSGDDYTATVYQYAGETLSSATWTATTPGYTFDEASFNGTNSLTVKADGFSDGVTIGINLQNVAEDAETLTVNSKTEALAGSTLTLSVSSNRSADASNREYVWSYAPKATSSDTHSITVGSGNKWNLTGIAAGTYVVTCKANYGTKTNAASGSFELTITDSSDYSIKSTADEYTIQVGDTFDLASKVWFAYKDNTPVNSNVAFAYASNKQLVASVTAASGSVKGVSDGTAKITVTATYTQGNAVKVYTKDITFTVNSLSATFDKSVTNGDDISYDDDDVVDAVVSAINKVYGRNTVSSSNISTLTITSAPATKQGDLYVDGSKVTGTKTITDKDIRFDAYEGFLGDATFVVRATTNKTIAGKSSFDVTLKVTVTGDDTINATVTGSSSNSSVSFKVSDAVDYDTLFIYGSKSSPNTSKPDYDGNWNATGSYTNSSNWDRCSSSTTITVPSSKFSSGKATLYVVGLDSHGVASTGTITVSQKSYDINYNVVAGKSVTFNQKDFESFLEDYAEDDGKYNPKKDEITFDHATLNSLPTAKSEGTLYYSGSEVTSSTNKRAEYTDMDKMTFEAVAKPSKDTVTLTFRVYGEIEKPNSRKPDKVDYYVNVVISVVKEDITYTVGIDDTVQLTARDFVNFLQDARTSYRKAELDYVKFDVSGKNVSSYAYGGLYRSYSSYSTGKLADSTDKFYYEPSRTQYDLADVAYHTTRWAEAGKTVYIPFTVYGTKNEEASGTMAITIAQTMNFIDVKASDFFYEPVKWAVNNKITNGTSSTTFSPYKNCNRAEIVTFLWRAAGSPEPTVTRNPFTDVNSVRDASYYKAILWASQKGITAGTNATTFSPYQECTRSQIVTFLYRYAGKPSGNYTNPFKDVSSVNEASYYNAILWAVGKGITQGTSTTTFSPYASCTRGEAVTFLYRYVNGVK